jgi:Kef-type K+ transport system membrane component KefB
MEQGTFNSQEEKKIAKKAKKRVQFKVHLMFFILINLALWLLFSFVYKLFKDEVKDVVFQFILFITLTWGICIIAHYLIVYKWNKTLVEKEIKHLKKEQERKRKEFLKQNK